MDGTCPSSGYLSSRQASGHLQHPMDRRLVAMPSFVKDGPLRFARVEDAGIQPFVYLEVPDGAT